ncbi:hypothetical protein [Nocardioides terrisoli]|uniref:hypothetical protein n=1 Tax=Nocardioides terrisoli TaxID=3388267 RepID=UPI00287B65F3|nr:hypothetical protein [Nocardioides marmorisolisilvae]
MSDVQDDTPPVDPAAEPADPESDVAARPGSQVSPPDGGVEVRTPVDEVDPAEHPAVTAVLSSLDRLAGLPVDEHVTVFEESHEALRKALSEARNDLPGPGPGA